jgi:hypothetical protein
MKTLEEEREEERSLAALELIFFLDFFWIFFLDFFFLKCLVREIAERSKAIIKCMGFLIFF